MDYLPNCTVIIDVGWCRRCPLATHRLNCAPLLGSKNEDHSMVWTPPSHMSTRDAEGEGGAPGPIRKREHRCSMNLRHRGGGKLAR